MSLPEITALSRVLARSNANDAGQQARNLQRLNELQGYLDGHADPGICACLDACSTLLSALADGVTPSESEILVTICRLMATVEKHWAGRDPDVMVASDLYGEDGSIEEPSAADGVEARAIASQVHGAKTAVFQAGDIEEAQHRIEGIKRTPRLNEMVLGELLVEFGHASVEEIQAALEEQTRSGELLGKVLVARGIATKEIVEETIELQVRLRAESTLRGLAEPPAPKPAPREPTLRLAGDQAREQHERSRDNTLGAILRRKGAISEDELQHALKVQRACGLGIGEVLVEMNATGWETINRAIELQRRLRNAAGLPGRPRDLAW